MHVSDEPETPGASVSEFENGDLLEGSHQLDDEITSASDKELSHFAQDDDTPENMVPHSEFKRRAAKRAVDEGMFDYLNHYDGKAAPAVDEGDSERSLEEELAQSLAVGKGFLSGLDDAGKLDAPEMSEKPSDTIEQSDIGTEFEPPAENEIDLTSFTQDESLSSFDTLPSESEDLDNDTDNSNLGGWRAIKAQMNEVEETPTFENEQTEDAPKSSWRALKEQVASEEPELPEDNSDKKEEATKSSLFSNLELDPDWAPKPPPEKVFKVKPEDDPDNN
jgi:pilus assembly protein FimV